MTKIIKTLLVFFLISVITLTQFTGCASNKNNINIAQNSRDYIEEEDYQYYLDSYSAFAKVKNGYYFFNNSLLYYYDLENNTAYPVCNKPNCEHNIDNCTAFFSSFDFYTFQLSYYNNALYLMGWEEDGKNLRHNYVYEISLDTFKRKKVAYLFDSTGLNSSMFIIHRGYIYYLYGNDMSMTDKSVALYRNKLGNIKIKDTPEIIYETKGLGAGIIDLTAYGNHLLLLTSSYEDAEGNGYKTMRTIVDIHSLEAKSIVSPSFASYANEEYVYYEKDENTVNCIELDTNKEKFFCNIDGPAYISEDSNYIYFDNLQSVYIEKNEEKDRKIFVYDKEGNYITEIVPKNPKDNCYFGGDDIMIFKENIVGETMTDDSDTNGAKGYYVLDKSQLTSPDKQFIDME